MRNRLPHGAAIDRRQLLCASAGLALLATGSAQGRNAAPRRVTAALDGPDSDFLIGTDRGAITSIRFRGDAFPTDYIAPGEALGHVRIGWRVEGAPWVRQDTTTIAPASQTTSPTRDVRRYRFGSAQAPLLELELRLLVAGETLRWEIALINAGAQSVEIGDLALPLPMATRFGAGQPSWASVMKHGFVSGNGSHFFWMRSNSVGPYLVMLPDRNTAFEYWDNRDTAGTRRGYAAYLHSTLSGAEAAAHGGQWRQPHTSLHLAPGETREYGLSFVWRRDYAAVRNTFVEAGLIDVDVVPGMTLPTDLEALVALRSADPVTGLTAEYPDATRIELVSQAGDTSIYRLQLTRLGENRITVHQGDGRVTHLEFFATEPVETLIAKRGAFIAAHRHEDPAKWYRGLLAEWAMDTQLLLGPDEYDRIRGWRIYEVTCDDPGLSKPAFLASKNALYPVASEVAALDDYIEHFVWGGLQRTTAERYPYGIYGIIDWKRNRDSADPGDKGQLHIWRPYDYPHIFLMYFGMYQVARDHPHIATRLSADTYLERAGQTAIAMFEVPRQVVGWTAWGTGFYNELVIPAIIDALDAGGKRGLAMRLRGYWEQKVRFFVNDNPDLFGSEYPFDSTGFESTQALARYARDHAGASLGVTAENARRFTETQIAANLFCRGWLEPAYYTLGSDYRGEGTDGYLLSYMAQMGGWAVLDYALNDSDDPHALLRLGSASSLSSWALLNSGTAESDYGYWYPGKANDGGAGGGFEPARWGETWLDQPHHRGSWYYSCEIDLGFCGGLRAARTLLTDDPIFGRIAMAGTLTRVSGESHLVPRDGVRRRFHARLDGGAIDLMLERDRFAAETPIRISDDLNRVAFTIESSNAEPHAVTLRIGGDSEWRLRGNVAGRELMLQIPAGGRASFTLTRA